MSGSETEPDLRRCLIVVRGVSRYVKETKRLDARPSPTIAFFLPAFKTRYPFSSPVRGKAFISETIFIRCCLPPYVMSGSKTEPDLRRCMIVVRGVSRYVKETKRLDARPSPAKAVFCRHSCCQVQKRNLTYAALLKELRAGIRDVRLNCAT